MEKYRPLSKRDDDIWSDTPAYTNIEEQHLKYKTTASQANERRRKREYQRRLNDPQWRENQILRIIRNSKGEPLRRQDFIKKTGITSPHVIRTHLEKLQKQNKIQLFQSAGNKGNRYTIGNQ